MTPVISNPDMIAVLLTENQRVTTIKICARVATVIRRSVQFIESAAVLSLRLSNSAIALDHTMLLEQRHRFDWQSPNISPIRRLMIRLFSPRCRIMK